MSLRDPWIVSAFAIVAFMLGLAAGRRGTRRLMGIGRVLIEKSRYVNGGIKRFSTMSIREPAIDVIVMSHEGHAELLAAANMGVKERHETPPPEELR